MEQEMLLMVLGEMTVAVSVVLSQSLGQAGGNRHSWSLASVRDAFKNYFVSSQGEVEWQYQYVRRTS